MVQIHSCQLGDFCDTYNYQPVFGSWVISGWLAILRNATERRRSLQQGSTGVKAKTSSYSYVKATLVNEDSKPLVIFACQRLIPVPTGAPFGSSEKGCQLACLLEFGSGAL